ncbi:MAG: hypothetical protein QOJ47_1844, partial [Gaiellales bacterium]|nr:hypothetical protein [Gaiellales bacterium]
MTPTSQGVPGTICLDGIWELVPGDDPGARATPI